MATTKTTIGLSVVWKITQNQRSGVQSMGTRVFFSAGERKMEWQVERNALPVADYHYTIDLFPGALPIRGTVTLKY